MVRYSHRGLEIVRGDGCILGGGLNGSARVLTPPAHESVPLRMRATPARAPGSPLGLGPDLTKRYGRTCWGRERTPGSSLYGDK